MEQWSNPCFVIAVILLVAGLGERLVLPAPGLFLVDISDEQHRARELNEASKGTGGARQCYALAFSQFWQSSSWQ
jgi:hypothetical protein